MFCHKKTVPVTTLYNPKFYEDFQYILIDFLKSVFIKNTSRNVQK